MFPQLVPLRADVGLHAGEADLDLGTHLRRHGLADARALHVHHLEAHERQHHARLAVELRHVVLVHHGLHARDLVLQILADLVGGLQAEEVEVPQQIVVDGQELQVELRQGERVVARVVLLRHEVGIPDELLRGHERQPLDVVLLQDRPLEAAHEDVSQQLLHPPLLRRRDLLLPLLLRAVLGRLLLLLGLLPLDLRVRSLDLLLHGCQHRVLGDVQVADLRAEHLQHVERQRPELRGHGLARVQRRHVRHRQLLHLLAVGEVREAHALQQLQALVVQVRDLAPRQRSARGVVDLEVLVVPQDAEQLVDEPGLGQLRDLGVAAAHGEVLVHEQRPEEAPRGQLVEQVDQQLDGALQERELLGRQRLLLAEALEDR
mmetsp:Transcript_44005/g.113764  ORF Transcript_44005/g.113764 Transcript_44005/m.113764 type:complete len:375 (+) Transcript_44005:2759-3883(+)